MTEKRNSLKCQHHQLENEKEITAYNKWPQLLNSIFIIQTVRIVFVTYVAESNKETLFRRIGSDVFVAGTARLLRMSFSKLFNFGRQKTEEKSVIYLNSY